MSAEGFKEQGDAYSDQKDWEKAVECYTQAILLDPKLSKAYNNRGISKVKLQRNEEAIADFDRAIQLDPKHESSRILTLSKFGMLIFSTK